MEACANFEQAANATLHGNAAGRRKCNPGEDLEQCALAVPFRPMIATTSPA